MPASSSRRKIRVFTCRTAASSLSMAETVLSKRSTLSTSSSMIFCCFWIKSSDFSALLLLRSGGADVPLIFHFGLFLVYFFYFFVFYTSFTGLPQILENLVNLEKHFFKKSLKIWKSQGNIFEKFGTSWKRPEVFS